MKYYGPYPGELLVRHSISWGDAEWAYRNGIMGWRDVVSLAQSMMARGTDDELIARLSKVDKSSAHSLEDALMKLVPEGRNSNDSEPRTKWLGVLLEWVYENRVDYADPLGEVEEIYADFDYPPQIEHFVRYMPVSGDYDPAIHSAAENSARLLNLWAAFVATTRPSKSDNRAGKR